jgi:hypothetical protein
MSMIYLRSKFHLTSYNIPLLIIILPEDKKVLTATAAILLLYVLKIITLRTFVFF